MEDFGLLQVKMLAKTNHKALHVDKALSEIDGCFWIIGRVGLQALKCVNDLFGSDFQLYEFLNNLENNIKKIFFNFFFQDRITSEKTNRSLEFGRVENWIFFRRIGFQILMKNCEREMNACKVTAQRNDFLMLDEHLFIMSGLWSSQLIVAQQKS
ncbi:hypothetical protein RhiirB3_471168 [Rhizophagus irregularis]|nr:hypothetical protein RhiirB3_471168 [Rhizophagus irregularis]